MSINFLYIELNVQIHGLKMVTYGFFKYMRIQNNIEHVCTRSEIWGLNANLNTICIINIFISRLK
jgi:hypothetical protein